MKKMMSLIVLVLVLALCPTPVKGQGQKNPRLTWRVDMDTTAVNYQAIVVTKNNDYIVSNNNFNNNHSLAGFNSQGSLLWQTSNDYWQMVDMNGLNAVLATNNNNDTLTIFNYSGDVVKRIAPPVNSETLRWVGFLAKDKNHYYVCYADSTGRDRFIFIYDNDLQYIGSFPLEANTSSNTIHGLVTLDGYIYISQDGYGTGNNSNVVCDIFKYDHLGNLIWKKHLLDRTNMYLAISPDGNLYMGALNTSTPSKAWLSWEFAKINTTTGDFTWDKLWFSDYPDTIFIALFVCDFKAMPNGGCVMSGQVTKSGMTPPFDASIMEPTMVAFNDQGEKIWEFRDSNASQYGAFLQIAWDKENYLIGSKVFGYYPWYQELSKYFIDGITAVEKENSGLPTEFNLQQNYPNPFNPTTKINFSVPQSGQVTLKVYDLLGREVAMLVNEELGTGVYNTKFDASQLSSGIYVYRLTAKNFTSSKKMMLVK